MNQETKHAATAHLYARADKLLARASELGITKQGKPLTRDQALELVCAEEGYRNRHVLLAQSHEQALAQSALAVPKTTGPAPKAIDWTGHVSLAQLQEQAAEPALADINWADIACVVHIERYVTEKHLLEPFLRLANVTIEPSDLTRGYHFWSTDDEASEDFPSWNEAGINALRAMSPESAHTAILAVVSQLNLSWKDAAMAVALEALERRWGAEHPYYLREDWQYDVANGDTQRSYWMWVLASIESNDGEDGHCSRCGYFQAEVDRADKLCRCCADQEDAQYALSKAIEPELHRAIKNFLSPKEQGRAMGAYRAAMKQPGAHRRTQVMNQELARSGLSDKLQARVRGIFRDLLAKAPTSQS